MVLLEDRLDTYNCQQRPSRRYHFPTAHPGFLSIRVWNKIIHMELSICHNPYPYRIAVFHKYGNTPE